MKKVYEAPRMEGQEFVANEYISGCGYLDNGTVLYCAEAPMAIRTETAYKRDPDNIEDYVLDDFIYEPRTIYMGSFYFDKEMQHPDATNSGLQHQDRAEDYGKMDCVNEVDKSRWGYHYHFTRVDNHS